MIETKVPPDIRKYKTKILGPLTIRQIICIAIAILVDILFYTLVYRPLDLSINFLVYAFTFIDVPILIFTLDVNGVPMEKYIKKVFFNAFVVPRKRKSSHKMSEDKKITPTDEKTLKKKKKDNPEIKSYR